jgi:hypothetical protein
MVLERLNPGAPRQLLDDSSRKLAFILCLPLIDGVFATLLVTGAVNTFSQMLNIAITIFTGAGALAVLYSEASNRKEAVQMVNNVILVLLAGVIAVALIAPIFEQLFRTELLKYAAGLAISSIALQLADIEIAERIPPTAVILTGLVLSYQGPVNLVLTLEYVLPALGTALIAITGLYLATGLKKYGMNLQYIRYGGSAVLGIIAMSLFGLNVPENIGPFVFMLSVLVSLRKS